jgi:hypothetical protein
MRSGRLALAASLLAAWPSAGFPAVTGPPGRVAAPLYTAVPWILPQGGMEIDSEAAYADHEVTPFRNLGLGPLDRSRELLMGGLAYGLDERTEGTLQFGWQESAGDDGSRHPQPTDLRLGLGYSLDGRGDAAVATAVRFAAKVPTAPDRHGSGTDEADLGFTVTSGVRTAHSGIYGSGGFTLLGNPLRHGSQDDILTLCMAGWSGSESHVQATWEVEGQTLSRFHNSSAYVHAGLRKIYRQPSGKGLAGYFSVARGLNPDSSRWGLVVGLSWVLPPRR